MKEDEKFRSLASRLSEQVTQLCKLVSSLQNSINVMSRENASLRTLFNDQSPPKSTLLNSIEDGSLKNQISTSENYNSSPNSIPSTSLVPLSTKSTTLISTPHAFIPSNTHPNVVLNQPSPIQLFSSSPFALPFQDDLMMSYLSSSASDTTLTDRTTCTSAFLFDNLSSPMMGGYYEDSIDEGFECFKSSSFGFGNDHYICDTRITDLNYNPKSSCTNSNNHNSSSHLTNTKSTRKSLRRPSGPLNILIVEDDPLCQQLISHIIKSLHIGNYELVADGIEAVINMSTGSFDLILMDMQLPHLDGLQATQNIRKFNRRTPIVSMTARLSDDDIKRYFEGGIDEVLPKPFDKQSVRRIIEQFYKLAVSDSDESINISTNNNTAMIL